MNAKHTVIAALAVILCGLAAGAAIGGRTETRVRTVAVTRTVHAAAPVATTIPVSSTTTTAATTTDPAVTTTPDEAPASAVYLVDDGIDEDQDDLSALDLSTSAALQDGELRDYSTQFELDRPVFDDSFDFWRFEIPVPADVTRFKTEMGFLKGVATSHQVEVTFYADELPGGRRLTKPEDLRATSVDDVDLDVTGVRTLILKIRPTSEADQWEDPMFVLGGAHFE